VHAQSYVNTPGYLFLAIGLILSLFSAFVPFFEAGYRVMTSVLIAGMIPYLIYGIVVPLSHSLLTTITGLFIVLTHALLVLDKRVINNADYSDGMIYYGPIIIAVIVLPLVIILLKKSLWP